MRNTVISIALLSLAAIVSCSRPTAGVADKGFVYVQAKEWNKQHPELPQWKGYPTLTVDSLGIVHKRPDKLNKYGSLAKGPVFAATGFYYATKYGERWVMVDPEGHLHIDALVAGVRLGGGETNKASFNKKFSGSSEKWITAQAERMISDGFCGAGSWSDNESIRYFNSVSSAKKFSYCPYIGLMAEYGRKVGVAKQLSGNVGYPNQCIRVFDPDFETFCEEKISAFVEPFRDDPDLVGYFSDNEMPLTLKNLEGYLDLPEDDYGHIAATQWLAAKGVAREDITDELREEFVGFVADRYYSIVSSVLKKYDPNHMYLGSRLHGASKNIASVYQAASRYCDIVSVNYYGFWAVRQEDISRWEEWGDKPFIITEFYTKAEDSGLTNVTGAGWLVHDQKSRGLHYENFIITLLRSNNCVGWSWFKYQDNDPTAKGVDPSNLNSNKGYVDNTYEPYPDLASSMKKVNSVRYRIALDL